LDNTDTSRAIKGEYTLTFNDPDELSKALWDDGIGYKAVMLSDDCALQKLFFWLNNND